MCRAPRSTATRKIFLPCRGPERPHFETMTVPSEELRTLRQRLRKVAASLDIQHDRARDVPPGDVSAHLLDDTEHLLRRARELTAFLTLSTANAGDELDDVVGRVALRDVSQAAIRLRQIVNQVAANLARIDAKVRLPEAVNDAEEELLQDLIGVLEWEASLKGEG